MSRANGYTSYRGSSTARPTSAELVDLHVYIVPPDIWRERYNNLLNQSVTETISAGIIRVHPEQKVYVLRDEIEQQIGAEILPREYVFLKSVGRSITRLKSKQEYQLKAKHFVPPQAYAPELYLLEIGPEDRDRSSQGSTRPQTRSPVYTNAESEDERQSSKAKQMHTSPYRYSPLPKIRSSKSPPRNVSPQRHSGSQKQNSSQRLVTPQKRSDPNSELYPPNDIDHRNDMPQNEVPYNTPSRQKSQDGTPKVEQNGDVRSENRQFMESARSNRDRRSDSRSHRSSRQSPMPESGKQSPKEEQPTARLSATPPPSADRQRKADRSHHKNEKYDAYTNHTNEDSGINVLTPEDQYEALDRRKQEEDQRQQDLQKRLGPVDDDDDDDRENRQRRLQDDRDNDEWERRRREEEERRRREEEERRRREEEENRRAEEERRRLQEDRDRMAKEQKFSGSDEDLNRFPSPPPMHRNARDSESAKRRKKEEMEKLKRELEIAREQRRQVEKQREELVKKAKLMQTKTQNRRNHARDVWKKRYFEEKKKTPPLEEQCNRLRHELDIIHRKLMNTLEGPSKEKSTRTADLKPSQKVGVQKRGSGGHSKYFEDRLFQKGFQRAAPSNFGSSSFHTPESYINLQNVPSVISASQYMHGSYNRQKSNHSPQHGKQNITSPLAYMGSPPRSRYSTPLSKGPYSRPRSNYNSPANSIKSVRFDTKAPRI